MGIQEYIVERNGEALPQLIVDANCTDTLPVDPVFSMIENGVGGQILVSSTEPSGAETSSTVPSNLVPSGITASAITLMGITPSAITAPELTSPNSTPNISTGSIIGEKLLVKYTLYAIDKNRQKSKPIEILVNLLLDDYANSPSLAKIITLSTPLHTQKGRHHNQADVDAFKFIAVAGGRYTFSSTSDVKMTLLDVTDNPSGVPVNLVSVNTPSVIPPVNTVVVSPPLERIRPSLPGIGEITDPITQPYEAFGISVPGTNEALGAEAQTQQLETGTQSEAQPTGGIPCETNGISMGTFYRDLKAGRSYVILVSSTSTKAIPGGYGFVVQVPKGVPPIGIDPTVEKIVAVLKKEGLTTNPNDYNEAVDMFLTWFPEKYKEKYIGSTYTTLDPKYQRMAVEHWLTFAQSGSGSDISYHNILPNQIINETPGLPMYDAVLGLITPENKYQCQTARDFFIKYYRPYVAFTSYAYKSANSAQRAQLDSSLYSEWIKLAYGLSLNEKRELYPVYVMYGCITGVAKSPVTLVEGIIAMPGALYALESLRIRYTFGSLETKKAIEAMVFTAIYEAGKQFYYADPEVQGRAVGELIGTLIGTEVIAAKGVGTLETYLKNARYADDLARAAKETARLKAVAEAIGLAPKLADDFAVAVRTGAKYGSEFKPVVGSVAVDATNTSRVGYGCNGIYQNNPSIISKVLGSTDEYVAFYRKTLTDAGIDEIILSNPSKFVGKDISAIKTEMSKLRAAIQKTKDAAASAIPPRFFKNSPLEPSFEATWLVENCAEIRAVRDAILQGSKIENIVLRSIEMETRLVKPFCKNCQKTFADFINSMN